MKKIGLLSDTHAYWDEKFKRYFAECDEIWHAGDIGSPLLAARFAAWKPFRAVYGNIDGQELRAEYPKVGFRSQSRPRLQVEQPSFGSL